MNYKEELKELIDFMSEDQAKLLLRIATKPLWKTDLLKAIDQETRNIDTALPIDYVRKLKDQNPNFDPQMYVMSYQDNSFGELVNVAEQLLLEINKRF